MTEFLKGGPEAAELIVAIERCHRESHVSLRQHALRHGCRRQSDAEDVVAAVFLSLLRRAHRGTLVLHEGTPLRAYVFACVTKRAHSDWKRHTSRVKHVEELKTYLGIRANDAFAATAFLECLAIDLPRAVHAAAEALRSTKGCSTDPELMAVTFADHEMGTIDAAEAAKRLGCAEASARWRLSRMRTSTRERLLVDE